MEYVISSIILLTSLLQGGYFHTPFLAAGVIFVATGVVVRKRRLSTAEITLWTFSCIYLITSLLRGYSSDSIAQACLPGTVAASLYCYEGLEWEKKKRTLQVLAYASAVFAGIGILALGRVWNISGAVTSHRLQFPFQYANAAGSWYAALALFRQDVAQKEQRWEALPLRTALFLTRSLGALGLYGAVEAAIAFRERKMPERWQGLLIENAFSAVFAAGFYLLRGWWTVLLLAAMYCAGVWEWKLRAIARKAYLHWLVLAAGMAGIYPIIKSGRVVEGLLTFTERLYQIKDGLHIIADYPLTGIGAGRWAYLYPYYQSARYVTTVVHSSLIQVGVDAGIFAVAFAIAFVMISWRRGKRLPQAGMAAALLISHSLLDFNFQFYPLCCLMVFLLFSGDEQKDGKKSVRIQWQTVALASFAVLCSILLVAEQNYKQLIHSNAANNWTGTLSQYERCNTLFGMNPLARKSAAYAAYQAGNLELCLALTGDEQLLDTETVLLRAEALYAQTGKDDAARYLLGVLEGRRYHQGLYQLGGDALRRWGADEETLLRHKQIAENTELSDFERRVEAFKIEKQTMREEHNEASD